jgi:hypothetical protein
LATGNNPKSDQQKKHLNSVSIYVESEEALKAKSVPIIFNKDNFKVAELLAFS